MKRKKRKTSPERNGGKPKNAAGNIKQAAASNRLYKRLEELNRLKAQAEKIAPAIKAAQEARNKIQERGQRSESTNNS
jgi:predicted nucleotide-binding protein (sugar kinase/HSP70/actin superfamily)